MNESTFIEQNIEQWQELEDLLQRDQSDPIKLHDLFVKVSSDFAYARTYFPNRMVRVYLNELTQRVFDKIHKKRNRFELSALTGFYQNILPRDILRNKWALMISLIVFVVAIMIGWLSSSDDPDFLRSILGDSYVEMTEENIDQGDPMAVYKKAHQVDMFLGITVNNIRVAINAYVLGLFFSIGSIVILLFNGVMLGSFQQFFFSEGLLYTSTLTIWIHGTLEISAIIIAGGAGIILGQGALMPGTLRRWTSFRIKARQSLNILLSTIPLFIVAGFLEGFITRMTDWPNIAKLLIIGSSLVFVIYMYIVYPIRRKPYVTIDEVDLDDLNPDLDQDIALLHIRNYSQNLSALILFLRRNLKTLIFKIIIPALLVFVLIFRLTIAYDELISTSYYDEIGEYINADNGSILFFLLFIGLFTYVQFILGVYFRNKDGRSTESWNMPDIRRAVFPYIIVSICWISGWYFLSFGWALLYYFVFAPHVLFLISHNVMARRDKSVVSVFIDEIKTAFNNLTAYFPISISVFVLFYVIWILYESQIGQIIRDFILWHEFFGSYYTNSKVLLNVSGLLLFLSSFVIGYIWMLYAHYSHICKTQSVDLKERFSRLKSSLD